MPFPATDPKAGANPIEDSQGSLTSAQTAAIQVFDGDGLSESERETLSRLDSERAAAAELQAATRPRGIKMKWSVDAQEDFKNVHDLNLSEELVKIMETESMLTTKTEDLKHALKIFRLPEEMMAEKK